MWSWWGLCPAPSTLGLVLLLASTTQAYFVLRFPQLRWVSLLLFNGILQGIAAGIGTSNFLRAAFIVSLNSSSFGSMKNIPLNCLALSSFGVSIAHFGLLFFFFFCIRHMRPHISPHMVWTRGCLFPCKSLSRPCVSVRRPFAQKNESCEACPCIWQFFFSIQIPAIFNIFLPQTVEWCVCGPGKGNDSLSAEFDSGYNVMTTNECSCHSPDKSLLAFSSSRVESSWSWVGECNSSEFPWRISCSFPRSGRSWVKVDVLRRCPHPKILTVPSATGFLKFPLLCGVNTSFALSLLAWSSDSVRLLQFFNVRDHYVSFTDFSFVKCITEKYTWQDFCAELM